MFAVDGHLGETSLFSQKRIISDAQGKTRSICLNISLFKPALFKHQPSGGIDLKLIVYCVPNPDIRFYSSVSLSQCSWICSYVTIIRIYNSIWLDFNVLLHLLWFITHLVKCLNNLWSQSLPQVQTMKQSNACVHWSVTIHQGSCVPGQPHLPVLYTVTPEISAHLLHVRVHVWPVCPWQ